MIALSLTAVLVVDPTTNYLGAMPLFRVPWLDLGFFFKYTLQRDMLDLSKQYSLLPPKEIPAQHELSSEKL